MLPLSSFAKANALSSNQKVERAEGRQRLPESVTAVLIIIAGPDRGISKKLEFASIIVGRQGADVSLNDPEISRQHCLLEIKEKYIQLKELDSTNSTFFEEERVRAAMLQDGAEFRVGSTVIRVTLTAR